MPSTVFLCTGCVLDPIAGGFGAGVSPRSLLPSTEGARGLGKVAPDTVGVAEDPGRRWGFLPGWGVLRPVAEPPGHFYVSRQWKRITSMKTLTTLH